MSHRHLIFLEGGQHPYEFLYLNNDLSRHMTMFTKDFSGTNQFRILGLSSARLLWDWGKNGWRCINNSYNKIQKGK